MRFATIASLSLLAVTSFAAPAAKRATAVKRTCVVRSGTPNSTVAAPSPPPTTPATSSSSDSPQQTPPPSDDPSSRRGLKASQLVAIDGASASCDGAPFPNECATAAKAAPFLQASFDKYGITSVGEKAALISLIYFETGALKYDRNHFPAPGRPGQGTRNLMMFPGVYDYATSLPETKAAALALAGTADAADDNTKNAIRELVLKDQFSFASAAWYYKTKCGNNGNVVAGLKAQTQAGWEAYITDCVQTTVTDDRRTSWQKALQVLKA